MGIPSAFATCGKQKDSGNSISPCGLASIICQPGQNASCDAGSLSNQFPFTCKNEPTCKCTGSATSTTGNECQSPRVTLTDAINRSSSITCSPGKMARCVFTNDGPNCSCQ
jgi:hypothetical protein